MFTLTNSARAQSTRNLFKFMLRILVPTLALGLWLPCAHAQVSGVVAQQVIAETGLAEHLKLVPQQVRAGMAEVAPMLGLPAELLVKMQRSADQAFAPTLLNDLAATALARDLHAPLVREALHWLRSPEGRRITSLELIDAAQSIDLQSWLARGNAAYAAASPQRRALLDTIEQSLQASEQVAEIQLQTVTALLRGVAMAVPQQAATDLRPVLAQMQRQRPQMVAAARGMVLASFASTYATLSDAELGRYVDFLRSPAGQHLNQAVMNAFGVAMATASESMGRALPALPAVSAKEGLKS